MKNFSPLYKFVTGSVMFTIAFLFMTNVSNIDIIHAERYLRDDLFGFLPKSLASAVTGLVQFFIFGLILVCAVRGAYRVCTFNQSIPTFDDSKISLSELSFNVPIGSSEFKNIDAVLSYRESKMSSMSPEKASKLMTDTAILDTLRSGYYNGPNTRGAVSYLESKLNTMSPDKAISYLTKNLSK